MEKLDFLPMNGAGRDVIPFSKSIEECQEALDAECWDFEDYLGKDIPVLDADPWQSNGGILPPKIRVDEKVFLKHKGIKIYLRYRYVGFSNGGGFLYCVLIIFP